MFHSWGCSPDLLFGDTTLVAFKSSDVPSIKQIKVKDAKQKVKDVKLNIVPVIASKLSISIINYGIK